MDETADFLVISTSLNLESRSRILAQRAVEALEACSVDVGLVDLATKALPPCDGKTCYEDPSVQALTEAIRSADGILLATPIYNYAACASAKNLLELTGPAWSDKVVGFLCSAGGPRAYMAVMGLANSLMLDFHTVVLPRFVQAEGWAFDGDALCDPKVVERVNELAATLVRFSRALDAAQAEVVL